MKRNFVLFIIFCVFTISAIAQSNYNFSFYNNLKDTTILRLDYSFMKPHLLGDEIAKKMYRMGQTYTYTEAPTPMSPTPKTVVKKPVIYYSILKLDKDLRKKVKNTEVSQDEAINTMGEILDLAFIIFSQETSEFENYLKNNKTPDDICKGFEMITLH